MTVGIRVRVMLSGFDLGFLLLQILSRNLVLVIMPGTKIEIEKSNGRKYFRSQSVKMGALLTIKVSPRY